MNARTIASAMAIGLATATKAMAFAADGLPSAPVTVPTTPIPGPPGMWPGAGTLVPPGVMAPQTIQTPPAPISQPATLPLTATYGDAEACQLYADGGVPYVIEPGGNRRRMIVAAEHIVGMDWMCEPQEFAGEIVQLLCGAEGREYHAAAFIREDLQTAMLTYADSKGVRATLPRCDQTSGKR